MTGRDLIGLILKYHLENQKVSNILTHAFLTAEELATQFEVGPETIKTWYQLNLLTGFEMDGMLYLSYDNVDPRTTNKGVYKQ